MKRKVAKVAKVAASSRYSTRGIPMANRAGFGPPLRQLEKLNSGDVDDLFARVELQVRQPLIGQVQTFGFRLCVIQVY